MHATISLIELKFSGKVCTPLGSLIYQNNFYMICALPVPIIFVFSKEDCRLTSEWEFRIEVLMSNLCSWYHSGGARQVFLFMLGWFFVYIWWFLTSTRWHGAESNCSWVGLVNFRIRIEKLFLRQAELARE